MPGIGQPFQPGRAKTGGRRKGTSNLVSAAAKALARALFDEAYWVNVRTRLHAGKLAPYLEVKLLAYAFGEPRHQINIPQVGDVADALRKKVIHELHPGPSKTRADR